MKITIDLFSYSCTGCGRCIRACQNNVLKLVGKGHRRFINVVHEETCNGCKECEKVCRHDAIKIIKERG